MCNNSKMDCRKGTSSCFNNRSKTFSTVASLFLASTSPLLCSGFRLPMQCRQFLTESQFRASTQRIAWSRLTHPVVLKATSTSSPDVAYVTPASTTTTSNSSSNPARTTESIADDDDDDDFREVGSTGLRAPPKGSVPEFAIEGDSAEETPFQRRLLATHFIIAGANLAFASSGLVFHSPLDVVPVVMTIMLSIILGDFGTGVFHWSVDNYGSINTPVFGTVCAAFQGHHVTPWTITFRGFANNVYKICYGTIPALLLVSSSGAAPLNRLFFTLFITWWMISQELHKYSHMRRTPQWIKTLQDMGIILSKKEHGLHHTAPFEGHYCILTGVCNKFLDDTKFFRYLEVIVYKLTGNKPNTWKEEPALEQLAMSLYGSCSG